MNFSIQEVLSRRLVFCRRWPSRRGRSGALELFMTRLQSSAATLLGGGIHSDAFVAQ